MRPYLSNYIQTLSGRRQERISDLLEEARVGKEQINTVLSRLDTTVAGGNSLILSKQRPAVLVRSQPFRVNVISMEDRIRELFDVSNAVSLLLNSHEALLASDVKAIEDELLAMEKMVDNFAFLLADNQAYDYAHLETFVDDLNKDYTLQAVPDRSNLLFGPSNDAAIHTSEGILTLPESNMSSHGMVGEIVKSNSAAFSIADTGLHNVFKQGNSTGWRKTILTSGPITAALPEAEGRSGAQIVLEFRLMQPAPCSEIKLSPYADTPVEVIQVTTFTSDEDAQGTEHISGIRILDRPIAINFPMRPVSKFRVVINQPTYHRVTKDEDILEYRYHHIIRKINSEDALYKKVRFVHQIEQSLLLDVLGQEERAVSLPVSELTPDRAPMGGASLVHALQFDRPSLWTEETEGSAYILFDSLFKSDTTINDIRRHDGDFEVTKNTKALATDNPISQVLETMSSLPVIQSGNAYYYNIGLHYVGIGVDSPGFKGVYVSKPIPSPGDIGAIRIKSEEENYYASLSSRASKKLTSIEYSVSNQSLPLREIDWRPILPVGVYEIEAERLFLDWNGTGFFRFPADSASDIRIFRNGYQMNVGGALQWIGSSIPGLMAGVRVGPSARAPEDIFTCDYAPAGDPTVVSFEGEDYRVPPLVATYDESGAGERFMATADRNLVTLGNHPYIDPLLASAGNYNPIVIQMEDGNVPQNLTDYRTRQSVTLPPDGYYYIHSGNTIMFNRPITVPFRVYYQHLQNNVRFRVVLRCNVKDFVSPQVSYVHLKAKTRTPDARTV